MSDPVQDLQKAREELVKMRRQWVSVLASPYERGTTGDAIKELIQLRKAIEAIDAAIPEEQRDSVPKSGAMKNFSTDDPYSEEEPGG